MDEGPVDFYSQERWDNWLSRIEEADIDDESEASRLFLNLQSDATIAIAKIVSAYESAEIDAETAADELATVHAIVLADATLENEDAEMLIEAVQTSLICPFLAADEYLTEGPDDADASMRELYEAASEAEAEEAFDSALSYMTTIGTRVIDGEELDVNPEAVELEYGLVTEWLGGLDSLQEALEGPKVVEDE